MPAIGTTATLWLAIALSGCTENTGSPQTQPAQGGWFASARQNSDPTPEEVARMLEPNVLGISCLYSPNDPWLWNTDHTRVRGIRINALYLQGPNYTGVFGDGIIRPKLFVSTRDEQGQVQYPLIKEWSLDVDQAMLFRAKKRVRAGWGYSLFLDWGDLDLSGRTVRLIVQFERADGIMITGGKKDFQVPRQATPPGHRST